MGRSASSHLEIGLVFSMSSVSQSSCHLSHDDIAHPDISPVAVLEVGVEIKQSTSRLFDVSVSKLEGTRTLDQGGQDREEVPLDVLVTGGMRTALHSGVQRILEDTMNRCQVVQTP